MSAQPARDKDWGPIPKFMPDDPSVFLSSRRTRLSFQRTRMSADRTLMSIIRTALSLLGFGFTIYQFFRFLRESVNASLRPEAARNFGFALVLLGVLMLFFGIVGHIRFMVELRRDHTHLVDEHIIPHDRFPFSVTLGAALLLLLIGVLAILSMMGRAGPFA
ncbi:MAG: YidH family protein [Longimicrobiales bacterium]